MTTAAEAPFHDVDPRVARAPKVLLHEHLDGGVRPATVLDLAREQGYADLPADTADGLARWFRESADSGSLELYLETFRHTVGVMQTADALRRVAREEVLDLAADGVVHAEVRYAPELHLERGLSLEQVVEAVGEGFREGEELARERGQRVRVTALLTAMRHAAMSREIADLVVRYRDQGVSGFDIAGAEAGHPPTRHLDAFQHLARANAHFTIHAGEAFGLPSIQEALTWCGADRLGHGVRIVDDMTVDGVPVPDWVAEHGRLPEPGRVALGRLAHYVRDTRVPLEMCPSSNVQTGASPSIALHPVTLLKDLRFRVTVNTDNRLMSDTSTSKEMSLLVREAGWTTADLERVTVDAVKSAFLHLDERIALVEEVIRPGYAALG